MEQQTGINEQEIKEDKVDLIDLELGEDKPQIEAKEVLVEELKYEEVEKFKTYKLKLICRHPDLEKPIEISGIEYMNEEKKIIGSGLWVKKDNENKVLFRSAIGQLLRFTKKKRLSELKGERLPTETNKSGYLVIKAY